MAQKTATQPLRRGEDSSRGRWIESRAGLLRSVLPVTIACFLAACNSVPKPVSETRDVVFEGQLIGQLTLTENYKEQVIGLEYRTSALVDQVHPWLAAYRFAAHCQTLAGDRWQISQPANLSSGVSHPATACQPGSFEYEIHFDS
ncbi:hypothetical protein ACTL6U_21425 [Rhodovibrionaceae bacterium A322]